MRITDDNTLEDIQGAILCLQWDVEKEEPEFPVAPRFRELIARIEDKLARNKNKARKNWFELARKHALAAEKDFLNKRPRDADVSLQKCWDHLEQGNKAHRRKTTFIASSDGMISSVAGGKGPEQHNPRGSNS
jgi:hypothetical protein